MRPIFLLIACLFSLSSTEIKTQKASPHFEEDLPFFESTLLDQNPKAIVAGCVNAK